MEEHFLDDPAIGLLQQSTNYNNVFQHGALPFFPQPTSIRNFEKQPLQQVSLNNDASKLSSSYSNAVIPEKHSHCDQLNSDFPMAELSSLPDYSVFDSGLQLSVPFQDQNGKNFRQELNDFSLFAKSSQGNQADIDCNPYPQTLFQREMSHKQAKTNSESNSALPEATNKLNQKQPRLFIRIDSDSEDATQDFGVPYFENFREYPRISTSGEVIQNEEAYREIKCEDDESADSDSGSRQSLHSEYELDRIRFSDIKLGKKIGDGSFGEVYEASLWSQPVAVKILRVKADNVMKSDIQLAKFQKEVSIMRSLRHPNIVEFMGVSFVHPINEERKLCIVTELLPNGNLEQVLSRRKLSWKRYFRFAKDIASGLNWLHHKGIIHRDLKPSNLLVTAGFRIKIADFGLSHMRNHPSKSNGVYSVCGTRCYIAPEVLQKRPYDTKADVFSFGVVLCEMISGRYPYETMDSKETYSLNEAVVGGARPRIPDDTPTCLRGLMQSCWQEEASLRPTMENILDALDIIEKQITSASRSMLDEELEDLPEEVRLLINEERLRLSEVQAELFSLRLQYEQKNLELNNARAILAREMQTTRKFQKDIQRVMKQRDRWRSEFEDFKKKSVTSKTRGTVSKRSRTSFDDQSESISIVGDTDNSNSNSLSSDAKSRNKVHRISPISSKVPDHVVKPKPRTRSVSQSEKRSS